VSQEEKDHDQDEEVINEKMIATNIAMERVKANPSITIDSEYTEKVMLYGYIMVIFII
jgi:hypothetical protein